MRSRCSAPRWSRVAETSYIGRLGTEPLAGIALVFPFVMLTQMMSAGAMGGGVSSAISRALGAGDRDRAATLALHAAMIGACAGIFFTVMMLTFGRAFYTLLGGRGGVLEQAMQYSQVLFSGAIVDLAGQHAGLGGARHRRHAHSLGDADRHRAGPDRGRRRARPWAVRLAETRHARRRRGPTHRLHARRDVPGLVSRQRPQPAEAEFRRLQIPARHVLRHPQGRRGVLPVAAADRADGPDLHQNPRRLRHRDAGRLRHGLAAGIPADADRVCVRRRLGADGRHGDGRGPRHARAAGGVDRGAGRRPSRSALSGLSSRSKPALWVSLFTSDPGVTAAAHSYFTWAGPAFAFFGLGACLYFSSQGAAKVGGPVMAGTARL